MDPKHSTIKGLHYYHLEAKIIQQHYQSSICEAILKNIFVSVPPTHQFQLG